MSQTEKLLKISKVMRGKAQEFLNSTENWKPLNEIVQHLDSGADTSSCLLALEMVFTALLKEKRMLIEIIPLKPPENTPENNHKGWLKNTYEECYLKILNCIESENAKVKIQAAKKEKIFRKLYVLGLATAMNILSYEGKNPLETKGTLDNYVPLTKLKNILMKILSNKHNNSNLITKFTEYLQHDDILFFTWKVLPSLTAKSNPNETYILNYLMLLENLQIEANNESKCLCGENNASFFTFEESVTKRSLNKVWNCLMLWEHSTQTHKQLLIVLLEKVLPHLEKPLLMTDFLMDSLDVGGPVSLLALQGIFTMVQVHNLEYPNIFTKLYSMFEPEIFHTKYKARLFYLSDLFLSSTHLPENMVAAFAKRLARLALLAPSEDIIIICNFIGNLIIRHPGLKCLLNRNDTSYVSSDPYIMEERDPLKSNAMNSSLWEIQTLQNHIQPSVVSAARFINEPLPSTEFDIGKLLENTADDIFDKEIKKFSKLIVLQFESPKGLSLNKNERVLQYWNI